MSPDRYFYKADENSPEQQQADLDLALAALWAYKSAPGVNERKDLETHAVRIRHEAAAVGNGRFPEDLLNAVLLHDLFDRLLNKESSKHTTKRAMAAAVAIADFMTDPTIRNERMDYIASVSADMVKVEQASGNHREVMAKEANSGSGRLDPEVISMMSEDYQGSIPPEVWRKMQPILDFTHMRQLTDKTNVESILIKALELADNMQLPSSKRESAQFQDYLEALSFYVPIVEVMTFDGAAAIVRNEAHKLSLKGQGLWRGELKERAESMASRLDGIGLQKIVEQVFGTDADKATVHHAVGINQDTGKRPMHIGEFAVEKPDGSLAAGNCRLKLEGTWAYKMDHDGAEPSDAVGLTIISKDLESSIKEFVDFLEHRAPDIQLKIPQSSSKPKTAAIYIQGSAEYTQAVQDEMVRRGLDAIPHQLSPESEDQAQDNGYRKYEVAKIYFEIDGNDGIDEKIPVELQFITRDERRRARTGEVAHVIYKFLSQFDELTTEQSKEIVCSATQELEEMYARTRHMDADSVQIHERSIPARDELYEELDSWFDRACAEGLI